MATVETRDQIIGLVVGLLHSPPSRPMLAVLITQSDAGSSMDLLAASIEASPSFAAIYPVALSNDLFADRYAHNILGDTVSASVMESAIVWLAAQLREGATRGELSVGVVNALGEVDADHPEYGAAGISFRTAVDAAITQVAIDSMDPVTDDEQPDTSGVDDTDQQADGADDSASEDTEAEEPTDPSETNDDESESGASDDDTPDVVIIRPGSDDTVVVADADHMGLNGREDGGSDAIAAEDLPIATWLDFDVLIGIQRVGFENQTTDQITDALNFGEFKVNLSRASSSEDTDTVDYSETDDSISVVVPADSAGIDQYVLVDSDSTAGLFTGPELSAADSRVDIVTNVERIVASQSESVLDLTQSTLGQEIWFRPLDIANRDAWLDRDTYFVRITGLAGGEPRIHNYIEYRDAGLQATVTQSDAVWNRVEGSDQVEVLVMNSAHSLNDFTANLRGGANQISYNELARSINTALSVSDFDGASESTALVTGKVVATTTFQNSSGGALAGGGNHVVTSYTADNEISAGSLRIEASRDTNDTLSFTGSAGKSILLGEEGIANSRITVTVGEGTIASSVILTRYEYLADFTSHDVYEMELLTNVLGHLTLIDAVGNDHDAIRVGDDAIAFNGAPVLTIDLDTLNAAVGGFDFDFDVLDVTKATSSGLTLDGTADGDDEVILGLLSQVSAITAFENVVLTPDSVVAGNTFSLNLDASMLSQGPIDLTYTGAALSAGGLRLDGAANAGYVSAIATAVRLTVIDQGGVGASLAGGAGNDQISGASGADTIVGGAGDDVLDGGIATEVRTIELDGILDAGNNDVTLTLGDGTNTIDLVINELTPVVDIDAATGNDIDIVVGAGHHVVGDALAGLVNANISAINAALTLLEAAVVNASYDSSADSLQITYAPGVDVTLGTVVVTDSDAGSFAASLESSSNGGAGGLDTFIFESTADGNGVDTIYNFSARNVATDDLLDFTAFLGATIVDTTAVDGSVAELTLSGGENIGIFFNLAELTTSQVGITAGGTVDLILTDNAKVVVLSTADVDGVSDAANTAYSAYYIEDTDTGAGQAWEVTLVGVLNSATESSATDFYGVTDAFV